MAEGVRGRNSGAEVCGISIDDLPDELLINIFSFFSFSELMDILQNVSTRWKRLAHAPELWLDKQLVTGESDFETTDCCRGDSSKCSYCRFEVKAEDVLRTAPTMPQLRKLNIRNNIDDRVMREICTHWPNLTVLHMDCSQYINYSVLEHIFKKCPKIKKLRIAASLLAIQRCGELLSSLKHLRSVEVYDNTREPIRLHVLADACPRLEVVVFQCQYYALEMNDVEYFFRTTKHSLTSATLPWMMEGMKCVLPLLKQCGTSLRKLHLLFEVPREQEAVAFEALGELRSLHELDVMMFSPCQPRFVSLAFRPGCLTQLRRLKLGYAGIQDETVVTILQGCPNLYDLRILGEHDVSDTALSELHRLKHLEILDLSGCDGLGGAAIAHVAQLPALHTLVLRFFRDLTELQPGLQQIVNVTELRCLNIQRSGYNTAVPFDEFPSRLVKLRELHVTYEGEEECFFGGLPNHNMPENFFSELKHKMPLLRVFNAFGSWR